MDQAEYERRARALMGPRKGPVVLEQPKVQYNPAPPAPLGPNIEDRRTTDVLPLDVGRAFDPTPLAKRIDPRYHLQGEFFDTQVPIDPNLDPGAVGRALGTDDLDKALRLNQLMSALGAGQGVG